MDNNPHHPTGEAPMDHRLLAVPEPLWSALTGWLAGLGFLVGTHGDLADKEGRHTYIVSPTDARIASTTERHGIAGDHRPPPAVVLGSSGPGDDA